MGSNDLIKARREAEDAVASMPNGELKTKAFEVILSHLLNPRDRTRTAGAIDPDDVPAKPRKPAKQASSKTERILALKNESYFQELKTIGEVRDELASRGWHYPLTGLSGPLQELVQRRELRRLKMTSGKKKVWKYSNP